MGPGDRRDEQPGHRAQAEADRLVAAAAGGSHSGSTSAVCSIRDKTPSRLWFSGSSTGLTRPGVANSPAQYHAELAGSTANPAATVPANTAAAVAAARYRRVSSRYAAKIAGVSLIPAARPIAAPFHREVPGSARSYSTAAARTRSTWP